MSLVGKLPPFIDSNFEESNKENSDFSMIECIRVTVSLNGTFAHLQNPVHLQVHFDKKEKS